VNSGSSSVSPLLPLTTAVFLYRWPFSSLKSTSILQGAPCTRPKMFFCRFTQHRRHQLPLRRSATFKPTSHHIVQTARALQVLTCMLSISVMLIQVFCHTRVECSCPGRCATYVAQCLWILDLRVINAFNASFECNCFAILNTAQNSSFFGTEWHSYLSLLS